MNWWRRRGLHFKVSLGVGLTLVLVLGVTLFVAARYEYVQLWDRELQEARRINSFMVVCLDNLMLANRWDQIWATALNLQKTGEYRIEDIALLAKRKPPGGTDYTQTALSSPWGST